MTTAEYRRRYAAACETKTKRPRISNLCFATQPVYGQATVTGWTLTLPLPPTKNAEPRNIHEIRRLRQHWDTLVHTAWSEAGRPRCEAVSIQPVFCLLKRNRDADNCIGVTYKALQDALRGRLVKDDAAKYLRLESPVLTVDGTPRLELHVRALTPADCHKSGEG